MSRLSEDEREQLAPKIFLTKKEIEMAEMDFAVRCPSGYMPYEIYMNVFRVPPSIAKEIFSFCDSDDDGYLEMIDILRTLVPLLSGDEDIFVNFVFRVMDEDGDGSLSKEDLLTFLQKFVSRNLAHKELVDEIFYELDVNQDNSISMDELRNVVKENPSFKRALVFRK